MAARGDVQSCQLHCLDDGPRRPVSPSFPSATFRRLKPPQEPAKNLGSTCIPSRGREAIAKCGCALCWQLYRSKRAWLTRTDSTERLWRPPPSDLPEDCFRLQGQLSGDQLALSVFLPARTPTPAQAGRSSKAGADPMRQVQIQ